MEKQAKKGVKPTKKPTKKGATPPKAKKTKDGVVPPLKIRKVLCRTREKYTETKAYLSKMGADFECVSSGNVESLIYGDREFTFVDLEVSGGNGHHISKLFREDIDAWILKNKGKIPIWDTNYTEQMFNLKAIEYHMGQQLTMIDINDCYWHTAYKLGYITELTYVKGRKLKAWKIGRNACIGALIKTKTKQGYTKGKIDSNKRNIVRTTPEYHNIRNHIIGHVHKIFNHLFNQMGNTFCMFLTDCIVTTYGKKREVERYLHQEGYKTKSKPIEFTDLDKVKRKISWHDFSAKQEVPEGANEILGVDRYYMYSPSQVVVSHHQSSVDYDAKPIRL